MLQPSQGVVAPLKDLVSSHGLCETVQKLPLHSHLPELLFSENCQHVRGKELLVCQWQRDIVAGAAFFHVHPLAVFAVERHNQRTTARLQHRVLPFYPRQSKITEALAGPFWWAEHLEGEACLRSSGWHDQGLHELDGGREMKDAPQHTTEKVRREGLARSEARVHQQLAGQCLACALVAFETAEERFENVDDESTSPIAGPSDPSHLRGKGPVLISVIQGRALACLRHEALILQALDLLGKCEICCEIPVGLRMF
mmetsp:Transcript_44400/g.94606  ORF Transcript_44400/g.94606 Transcript_44400/m.94606 type:complete len:256 (-) Transcript_44400:1429-2196(-)